MNQTYSHSDDRMEGALADLQRILAAASLPQETTDRWLKMRSEIDRAAVADDHTEGTWQIARQFLQTSQALIHRLPARSHRTPRENTAAEMIREHMRAVQTQVLHAHGEHIYIQISQNYRSFIRGAELVDRVGEEYPGLVPSRDELAQEHALPLKEKEGLAIDQGIFLEAILSQPRAGAHLIQSMLQPKAESLAQLAAFQRDGVADLGAARVERHGSVGYLDHVNPRYLNAEDEATTQALEIGIDLILLDPAIQVGVIRGSVVDHVKYRGRRVFNAGLNLTHLYAGRLPFLFFITRELGYLNKIYRGLATPDAWMPGQEQTHEKPWIGAVEAFAVGGGCQLLLVLDYVLAEAGSFFTLPAMKEGIIPGVANLRLSRFLGARGARRLLLAGQPVPADSVEGRLLCDTIVPVGAMDEAIRNTANLLTQSGLISVASNRKLLRLGEEPISAFQRYMAAFVRAQAECYASPLLVRNLENSWVRRQTAPSA